MAHRADCRALPQKVGAFSDVIEAWFFNDVALAPISTALQAPTVHIMKDQALCTIHNRDHDDNTQ